MNNPIHDPFSGEKIEAPAGDTAKGSAATLLIGAAII